jgi:hypothetical protein
MTSDETSGTLYRALRHQYLEEGDGRTDRMCSPRESRLVGSSLLWRKKKQHEDWTWHHFCWTEVRGTGKIGYAPWTETGAGSRAGRR